MTCGEGRTSGEDWRMHAVLSRPPQVQLHLVEMTQAIKGGLYHQMYKVCRDR